MTITHLVIIDMSLHLSSSCYIVKSLQKVYKAAAIETNL